MPTCFSSYVFHYSMGDAEEQVTKNMLISAADLRVSDPKRENFRN